VTVRYRRAHCCTNVAAVALVRLRTKLKNQSALTQITYLGGENAGGAAKEDGIDASSDT